MTSSGRGYRPAVLKVGAVGGPAGVSAIVIAGTDHGPAGMGLAFDVGRGGLVLRVQRVELLVEPRARWRHGYGSRSEPASPQEPSWPDPHCRSIVLLPEAKEAA